MKGQVVLAIGFFASSSLGKLQKGLDFTPPDGSSRRVVISKGLGTLGKIYDEYYVDQYFLVYNIHVNTH